MGQGPEFGAPDENEPIFPNEGLPGTPSDEKPAEKREDPRGFKELTGEDDDFVGGQGT